MVVLNNNHLFGHIFISMKNLPNLIIGFIKNLPHTYWYQWHFSGLKFAFKRKIIQGS